MAGSQPGLPDEDELLAGASDEDSELYKLFYWDSACSYPDRGDISVAVRESDIETRHDLRKGGFFNEMMRPGGIDDEMILALHAGAPQRTLRLLFFRGPGIDFSARDVAVLTLLRPHLQAAYLAHERNRRGPSVLTGRQREILAYVALGYTNRQIARRLELSETTVRKHLENVFARLDVSSRTAAIAKINDDCMPDGPHGGGRIRQTAAEAAAGSRLNPPAGGATTVLTGRSPASPRWAASDGSQDSRLAARY